MITDNVETFKLTFTHHYAIVLYVLLIQQSKIFWSRQLVCSTCGGGREQSLPLIVSTYFLVQAASVEAKLAIVLFQVAPVESKLAIVFTAFFLFGSGVNKLTIVITDFRSSLSLFYVFCF